MALLLGGPLSLYGCGLPMPIMKPWIGSNYGDSRTAGPPLYAGGHGSDMGVRIRNTRQVHDARG